MSETTFDLLEGSADRLFLYIHTGKMAITMELDRDDDELDKLRDHLGEPPSPV